MNNRFIIRLPVKPQEPVLLKHMVSGSTDELESVAALHNLRDTIAGRPVTILVPGELVAIHFLEITGRLTPAVLQSIPYRLEDDLANDVDDLHITLLEKNPEGVFIAVVENQWMQLWHSWLEEAGIHADQWLPDTLAVPLNQENCSAVRFGDTCLLRTAKWDAVVCDNSWLSLYLDSRAEEQQKPFICYGEPDSFLPEQWQYQSVNSPLEPLDIDPSVNLLQGRWQQKAPWKKHLKPFQLSATLAALAIAGWFSGTLYETYQLQQQAQQYQLQARQTYQQLFPGERVVRLQSQLNQKINMLEQSVDTDSSLLALLDQLTPVFQKTSGLTTRSLQFDRSRNSLRIEASAPDFDTFSTFRELAGQLVEVNVESLEQKEQQVEGVLSIWSQAS